jgi:type III secretion protein S
MFNTEAMQLTQQALWLVLILSAPAVLAAAVVGLVIAFIQAATQLQEQTFQYAVKFFAITLVILVTASLLGGSLVNYSDRIFSGFPGMVRK